MSDLQEPVEPIDDEQPKPVKQKRVLSEAQLENLSKARAKAKEALKLKKSRNENIKMKKRLIKTAKKEHEESLLDDELKKYKPPKKIEIETEEEEPSPLPTNTRKARRKKVVYITDSDDDSDSESEEEIVYKRRPKLTRQKSIRPRPVSKPIHNKNFGREQKEALINTQHDNDHDEQTRIDNEYNKQVERYRREMIRKAVFPD